MSYNKIITYDLRVPGRNYEELYLYLDSFAVQAKITESTRFVSTQTSCSDIMRSIKTVTDSNDGIFVAELTGNPSWSNVIGDPNILKINLRG